MERQEFSWSWQGLQVAEAEGETLVLEGSTLVLEVGAGLVVGGGAGLLLEDGALGAEDGGRVRDVGTSTPTVTVVVTAGRVTAGRVT